MDLTTPITVVVLITGNACDGINNTVTAVFSSSLSSTPTLGTCLNGTVNNISGSGTTYTFTWNPTTTSATSFNFIGITGYTSIISTNTLTPVSQATVLVYGTSYDGINNTITATFSNIQTSTPSLGSNSNGTVSGISGSGLIYTFTWNPVNTNATSFNFTSVTGYSGTLISIYQLTPYAQTTATVSIIGSAYDSMGNIITVTFNNSQITTPTLGTCSNGTVTGISGSGTTFTFTWTPTTISATSFNFTNVLGYTGTLTSGNQITPLAATTGTVSGNSYTNMGNTITVVFNNTQTIIPSLGSNANGTVTSISGSGTTYTFIWTPTSTSSTSFNFTSVTGYSGTLTSSNSLTPLAQTIISSVTPTTLYINITSAMTAVFSNSLTSLPTITVSSGIISGAGYSGTNVTFNWTPTSTGTSPITFNNITGQSGILTSSNLTIVNQTTASISGIAYINQANTLTVVFSNSQTSTPSLGSCANGTVTSISGSGTTYTFTWTPTAISTTSFNFTGVLGYTGGAITSSNTLTPTV